MSTKVLKNCKKAILNILKTINYDTLNLDFEEIIDDRIEEMKLIFHKDYPYVYNDFLSKAIIKTRGGFFAEIIQAEETVFFVKIKHKENSLTIQELDGEVVYQYARTLKQAYSMRDFWNEIEF